MRANKGGEFDGDDGVKEHGENHVDCGIHKGIVILIKELQYKEVQCIVLDRVMGISCMGIERAIAGKH